MHLIIGNRFILIPSDKKCIKCHDYRAQYNHHFQFLRLNVLYRYREVISVSYFFSVGLLQNIKSKKYIIQIDERFSYVLILLRERKTSKYIEGVERACFPL